jgi:hypothetical protein
MAAITGIPIPKATSNITARRLWVNDKLVKQRNIRERGYIDPGDYRVPNDNKVEAAVDA